jgi:hypothetical protein
MPDVRIDRHGWYVVPIWFGLLVTGIYVLFTPEDSSVASLPNWFDNLLGFLFAFAAATCLYGVAEHDWRKAYKMEIGGLAVICIVLGILATVTNLTLVQQFTLAGGLGALVQIGSLRAIVELWLALRRDVKTAD